MLASISTSGGIMWRGIELRDLETFLALADELHFGRTAERLGISVSYVSQRIGVIERRLNVKLFERTSRRVRLTVLGQIFADDVAPIVAELNRTLSAAAGMAAGLTGTLRVGHLLTVDGSVAVRTLVDEFQAQFPAISVKRLRVDVMDYVNALHQDEMDVWLTWWPSPAPTEDPAVGLRCGPPIARERPALLVGRSHPLAQRSSISLNDLAEHPVIGLPDFGPELFRRQWNPTRTPDGRPIRQVQLEPKWQGHFHELSPALEQGRLGWFTISSFLETVSMRHDPVTVPIEDGSDFVLLPWWEAARETPAIRAFVGLGGELLDQAGRGA